MLDLNGLLTTNKYTPFILICVDNASRIVMLERIRKMNMKGIMTKLDALFVKFGFSESVLTENVFMK